MTDGRRGRSAVGVGLAAVVLFVLGLSLLTFPPFDLTFLRTTSTAIELDTPVGGTERVFLPPTGGEIELRLLPPSDFEVTAPAVDARGELLVIDDCASGCTLRLLRNERSSSDARLEIDYTRSDSEYVDEIQLDS